MARDLRRGVVSFDTFLNEFGDSPDELISDLCDLLEHEPKQGGLFGVSDKVHADYQANIDQAIRALEEA
jgi:hypothetical protein